MRIPGFPLLVKATGYVVTAYHSLSIKNIEMWFWTLYVNWWPVVIRFFS